MAVVLLLQPHVVAGERTRLIDRDVAAFHSTGESRLKSLLRFARENRVCFGIEFTDPRLQERAVLDVAPTTLRRAVNTILRAEDAGSFVLAEVNGVVIIRKKQQSAPKWLDQRLRRFRIPKTPIVPANLNLFMAAECLLRGCSGFAGSAAGGDPSEQVGPLHVRNATIREVLCLIVAAGTTTHWMLTSADTAPNGNSASINPYWTLLFDADPMSVR